MQQQHQQRQQQKQTRIYLTDDCGFQFCTVTHVGETLAIVACGKQEAIILFAARSSARIGAGKFVPCFKLDQGINRPPQVGDKVVVLIRKEPHCNIVTTWGLQSEFEAAIAEIEHQRNQEVVEARPAQEPNRQPQRPRNFGPDRRPFNQRKHEYGQRNRTEGGGRPVSDDEGQGNNVVDLQAELERVNAEDDAREGQREQQA